MEKERENRENEDKKREKKDLAVVQRVVDVGPVGGAEILGKLNLILIYITSP